MGFMCSPLAAIITLSVSCPGWSRNFAGSLCQSGSSTHSKAKSGREAAMTQTKHSNEQKIHSPVVLCPSILQKNVNDSCTSATVLNHCKKCLFGTLQSRVLTIDDLDLGKMILALTVTFLKVAAARAHWRSPAKVQSLGGSPHFQRKRSLFAVCYWGLCQGMMP